MWISKNEYNELKNTVKNNKYDADMFRKLIEYIKEKKTVVCKDFIIINSDVWIKLTNKFNSEEDKVKDIQAELEWYKTKYHEMKTNKDAKNVAEICLDCGNYGWDIPQCAECCADNCYKYYTRKYNDNE